MMRLSNNALRVLQARYLRRDAERHILETPEDMFARVADAALAEAVFGHPDRVSYWRDECRRFMTSLTFLPNSPTLMNAPNGQLSACFVLPVEDSIEDIFKAVTEMALVQRSGGGTGFSLIIAGTSASIEPLFALAYRRRHTMGGESLTEVNRLLLDYCSRHGLNTEKVIAEVQKSGRLAGVTGVPNEATRLFVTALDIPVERHLQMQAAFQRHVDNSASKTINLLQEATTADVARA